MLAPSDDPKLSALYTTHSSGVFFFFFAILVKRRKRRAAFTKNEPLLCGNRYKRRPFSYARPDKIEKNARSVRAMGGNGMEKEGTSLLPDVIVYGEKKRKRGLFAEMRERLRARTRADVLGDLLFLLDVSLLSV